MNFTAPALVSPVRRLASALPAKVGSFNPPGTDSGAGRAADFIPRSPRGRRRRVYNNTTPHHHTARLNADAAATKATATKAAAAVFAAAKNDNDKAAAEAMAAATLQAAARAAEIEKAPARAHAEAEATASVAPDKGTVDVAVTISGSGLRCGGAAVAAVLLAGVAARVQYESDAKVVVVAAMGTPTTGDVGLVADNGKTFTIAGAWAYYDALDPKTLARVNIIFDLMATIRGIGDDDAGEGLNRVELEEYLWHKSAKREATVIHRAFGFCCRQKISRAAFIQAFSEGRLDVTDFDLDALEHKITATQAGGQRSTFTGRVKSSATRHARRAGLVWVRRTCGAGLARTRELLRSPWRVRQTRQMAEALDAAAASADLAAETAAEAEADLPQAGKWAVDWRLYEGKDLGGRQKVRVYFNAMTVSKVISKNNKDMKAMLERKRVHLRPDFEGWIAIDIDMAGARRDAILAKAGNRTPPLLFVDDEHIGGYERLLELDLVGNFDDCLAY